MQSLDLRATRCPLALVLLKQKLQKIAIDEGLELLFSNGDAMQDILLYLDKKHFSYQCYENSIIVTNSF